MFRSSRLLCLPNDRKQLISLLRRESAIRRSFSYVTFGEGKNVRYACIIAKMRAVYVSAICKQYHVFFTRLLLVLSVPWTAYDYLTYNNYAVNLNWALQKTFCIRHT